MFVEYVANKHTATQLTASNGYPTRGGQQWIVALQSLEGVDFVTFVAHLTQSAGTTKIVFQGALSTDGPWIDLHTFTTVNASDSTWKQQAKFPLFRLFVESIGTGLSLTAAVIG